MSFETNEAVEQTIKEILNAGDISLESWNDVRSTLLRSSPVWPGADVKFDNPAELAPFIDHTLLKADATDDDIAQLCEEAAYYQFASVCVNSCHVKACVSHLSGTEIPVCNVVGFPLGAMSTEAKRAETQYVIDNGGREIDMVMNIGKFKSGDAESVCDDIRAVVDAAWGNPVKVILETGFLSDDEVIVASVIAILAGATFVKTSTGMGPGGATEATVNLMRRVAGANLGVKASGGIRDTKTAIDMIQSGANRIGTSSGVKIVGC